jgi:hypothetical protein
LTPNYTLQIPPFPTIYTYHYISAWNGSQLCRRCLRLQPSVRHTFQACINTLVLNSKTIFSPFVASKLQQIIKTMGLVSPHLDLSNKLWCHEWIVHVLAIQSLSLHWKFHEKCLLLSKLWHFIIMPQITTSWT